MNTGRRGRLEGRRGADERPADDHDERGSALIIAMVVLLMLMLLALSTLSLTDVRSKISMDRQFRVSLHELCETGIALSIERLAVSSLGGAAMEVDAGDLTFTREGVGTCEVDAATIGEDSGVRITATATSAQNAGPTPIRHRIEVVLGSTVSPAFRRAVYVGNRHGIDADVAFGPNADGGSSVLWEYDEDWTSSGRVNEAEYQIDFNGDGDLNDDPRLRDLYGRSGTTRPIERQRVRGSYQYRMDMDADGAFDGAKGTLDYAPAAPEEGTERLGDDWDTTWSNTGDYIDGDIYVNGNVSFLNDTTVWGNVETTSDTVTGGLAEGTVNTGQSVIAPPDLSLNDYENTADIKIYADDVNDGDYENLFMPPRTGDDDFYGDAEGHLDNPVIHLGDSGRASTIAFDESHDGKVIFVKGNLWVHSASQKVLKTPSGVNIKATIVVEGNLYIGDDINYGNDNTGLLFIVKGKDDDPNTLEREDESFVDTNKNYRYDPPSGDFPGEPIINDDGNGTYDGPSEGQGNIYYGDVAYGTGGVTDGFMYAQNNAYLRDPGTKGSISSDQDKIYGVNGFLNAGGILDLGVRRAGEMYRNYRVKYDARIDNPQFQFPGMPAAQGGGLNGLSVLSWRVMPAGG